MDSQPMKACELGRFVCVARGGCLHTGRRGRTIDSDGVWVRSPDLLNPGSHLYSSAHRDCYERWAASEKPPGTSARVTYKDKPAGAYDHDVVPGFGPVTWADLL